MPRPKGPDRKKASFRIRWDLMDRLQKIASHDGTSVTELLDVAISNYVKTRKIRKRKAEKKGEIFNGDAQNGATGKCRNEGNAQGDNA